MTERHGDGVDQSETEVDRFDQYEEKSNELWEGLLRAYCAGFAKAAEAYSDEPLYVDELMNSDHVSEMHYYYWDGRTLPLEHWLQEQFGVGIAATEGNDA